MGKLAVRFREGRYLIGFIGLNLPTINNSAIHKAFAHSNLTVRFTPWKLAGRSWKEHIIFQASKENNPWKLTWHWKIPIFNRKCIFNWWIFQCHVSFFGSITPENACLEDSVSFLGGPGLFSETLATSFLLRLLQKKTTFWSAIVTWNLMAGSYVWMIFTKLLAFFSIGNGWFFSTGNKTACSLQVPGEFFRSNYIHQYLWISNHIHQYPPISDNIRQYPLVFVDIYTFIISK